MYLIEPYKSIGDLNLGMQITESDSILGKGEILSNKYLPDIIVQKYINGTTMEFKNNFACFIGILISLNPIHLNFYFKDKDYDQILNYFKEYSGKIFCEGETMLVSEYLGITAYFEDGIKEVGIFSNDYKHFIIDGLEII